MTNMTYVSAIEFAINALSQGGQVDAEEVEVVEKLSALKESLIKRNSRKSSKPTKKQTENLAIKEAIKDMLANADGMTATEVATAVNVSPAKATALLTQLVKAEEIKRTVEKKVARFSI